MFGPTNIFSKAGMRFIWDSMTKKKELVFQDKTELNRVMSIFDLVFLGIGSMLGMGVYIMSGSLAKTVGPAMVLSFILAGIAALLSALCYAEFAGRAPGTGSAYAYCYITVGEFIAFVLGWNLALEFVIGTACLARGLSGYLDSVVDNKMSDYLTDKMGLHVSFLSAYPDFLAFFIMALFTALVSVGVKASTTVNNIFVVINLVTISAIVIFGIIHSKAKNWGINKSSIDPKYKGGDGGFLPYGFSSIIEGAATCFYAYTGFDTVATTGGEARNPQRAIPIALILSMTIAMTVYTAVSATFTLMWPYYNEDTRAPYPFILKHLESIEMNWVVIVGAISAILGCIVGSVFGMARIIYSIAYDGLLYRPLAKVNHHTKTPITATVATGLLTGLISIIFDTDQLISMTSIGTLMAYTMVAVCVLVLRYEPKTTKEEMDICVKTKVDPERNFLGRLFNYPYVKKPTEQSGNIARVSTYLMCLFVFLLCGVLAFWTNDLFDLKTPPLACAIITLVLFVFSGIVIGRQPSETKNLMFKVRPVPLLPAISIFINVYLMLKLDKWTWVRFAVWLVIGLVIYFGYGIWHSNERKQNKNTSVNSSTS